MNVPELSEGGMDARANQLLVDDDFKIIRAYLTAILPNETNMSIWRYEKKRFTKLCKLHLHDCKQPNRILKHLCLLYFESNININGENLTPHWYYNI